MRILAGDGLISGSLLQMDPLQGPSFQGGISVKLTAVGSPWVLFPMSCATGVMENWSTNLS